MVYQSTISDSFLIVCFLIAVSRKVELIFWITQIEKTKMESWFKVAHCLRDCEYRTV